MFQMPTILGKLWFFAQRKSWKAHIGLIPHEGQYRRRIYGRKGAVTAYHEFDNTRLVELNFEQQLPNPYVQMQGGGAHWRMGPGSQTATVYCQPGVSWDDVKNLVMAAPNCM